MPQDTLTITDNRTGQSYTLPVENGTIRAMDLRQIKTGPEDFGLMTYDPAGESCATAVIPSRFSPNTAPISKLPTCFCSANCPPRVN
jgi:hypothetical protein